MIKVEKKKVEIEKEVITEVRCDRCNKDLGTTISYNFKGGYFCPVFPWGSGYCDSSYEDTQIHLCDNCWDAFYNNFIFDRVKRMNDEEE